MCKNVLMYLVGGLEHFLFFHISAIIIPTDYFFQRGRYTTNQCIHLCIVLRSLMIAMRLAYVFPAIKILVQECNGRNQKRRKH